MGCQSSTASTNPAPTTQATSNQPVSQPPKTVAPPPQKAEPPKQTVVEQKKPDPPKVQPPKQSTSPATQPASTTAARKFPIMPEDVGKYLNQARTNPQSLVAHIEKQLAQFKGNMGILLWPGMTYQTNQGKKAWEEARDFLKKQKPIKALTINNGLNNAAAEHAIDLAAHDLMGHVGSNGSTMQQRISKYCDYSSGSIGENVAQEFSYEGRDHALEAVVSLIIDDGVSDRGHRKSIFDEKFNYFGAACRENSEKLYLVVINYASDNLKDKAGAKPPAQAK